MLIHADARAIPLADNSAQCIVTSPPYWGLRSYGAGPLEIGQEVDYREYIAVMVQAFEEVWRVLKTDGVCWLNLGDCYANDGKWGGETGGKQGVSLGRRSH